MSLRDRGGWMRSTRGVLLREGRGGKRTPSERRKENRGEAHEASVWDRWEGAMDSPYEMRGMVFEYGGNGPDR